MQIRSILKGYVEAALEEQEEEQQVVQEEAQLETAQKEAAQKEAAQPAEKAQAVALGESNGTASRPTYILLSVPLSVALSCCQSPAPSLFSSVSSLSPSCLPHFFVWGRRHWRHSGLASVDVASARGSSWVLDSTAWLDR